MDLTEHLLNTIVYYTRNLHTFYGLSHVPLPEKKSW
jgi:hypothetical protein